MPIEIIPGHANHPANVIADLIWSVDEPLMRYVFLDKSNWSRVLATEWPETDGVDCHQQAMLAVDGPDVVGVIVSHTPLEFERHLECSRARIDRTETAQFSEHVARALDHMEQLFPHPLPSSYYIFDLAVAPKNRNQGVGRRLFEVARAKAVNAGCNRICLDVAAESDAVRFYERIGMEVAVETRVPYLANNHGIGKHVHMTLSI